MESHKSDPWQTFESLVEKSRQEEPPKLDVRLLVRAALITGPAAIRESDWMDVLLRFFSAPATRIAVTACFVALLAAAPSALEKPSPEPQVDLMTAFLLEGQ